MHKHHITLVFLFIVLNTVCNIDQSKAAKIQSDSLENRISPIGFIAFGTNYSSLYNYADFGETESLIGFFISGNLGFPLDFYSKQLFLEVGGKLENRNTAFTHLGRKVSLNENFISFQKSLFIQLFDKLELGLGGQLSFRVSQNHSRGISYDNLYRTSISPLHTSGGFLVRSNLNEIVSLKLAYYYSPNRLITDQRLVEDYGQLGAPVSALNYGVLELGLAINVFKL